MGWQAFMDGDSRPGHGLTRRDFLKTLAGAGAATLAAGLGWRAASAAGLSVAGAPSAAPGQSGGPLNFIVILADDLSASELGCYGHPEHRTPRLDRLAAEGMRFRTCFAAPICTPSRVMIMTGQYGFHNGYFDLNGQPYTPLPDSPEYDIGSKLTFADVLKSRGYATGLAGKWQLSGQLPTLVNDCGFDEYLIWAYQHNLPPGVTHPGTSKGKEKKTSRYWQPCLLRNGQYVPTTPDDYGPDYFTEFAIDFIRRHRAGPFCFYFPMVLTHAPWDPTPDLARPGQRTEGGFAANLAYLDHCMGRVVDAVDQLGLRENTAILFTGDNATGNAGKGTVTERGARVPLIARCPGTVKPKTVRDELADLSDFLPTLAEMAGARLPAGHIIDGVSLVPTLRGAPGEHRPWIFSFRGTGRILRDKRWLMETTPQRTRFYDCGANRDGVGYEDVTDAKEAEAVAARQRFEKILEHLPGPENHPGLKQPPAGQPGKKGKGNKG